MFKIFSSLLLISVALAQCPPTHRDCAGACFNPSDMVCLTDFNGQQALCPVNHLVCNKACFNPSMYNCQNGQLRAGPSSNTGGNNGGSGNSGSNNGNTDQPSTATCTRGNGCPNNLCSCDGGCYPENTYGCPKDSVLNKNIMCRGTLSACNGRCFDPNTHQCTNGAVVVKSTGNNGNNGGVVANPTPAPAPPPAGTLSSKAGLAWPINQFGDGTNPPMAPYAQGRISWIYTWSYDPYPAVTSSNLEWVPMLHKRADADAFISRIKSGAYDKYPNVLLFNEPDLNYPPYAYPLDVNSAIGITIQVFQAMRERGRTWRVGTPVMASNMNWLQQYLAGVKAQCSYCQFAFVPVHCYNRDANGFKGTVQAYRNTFNLPIWVTEWAATDFNTRNWQVSLGDVQNYMADTTGWLNQQSWVERYSWFGVMRAVDIQDKANIAMNRDGSRNALGEQYVLRGGAK